MYLKYACLLPILFSLLLEPLSNPSVNVIIAAPANFLSPLTYYAVISTASSKDLYKAVPLPCSKEFIENMLNTLKWVEKFTFQH